MLCADELIAWAEEKACRAAQGSSNNRKHDKGAGMISEVAPRLFVGNVQAAKNKLLLAEYGISSIVNVGGGSAALGSRTCSKLKLRNERLSNGSETHKIVVEVDGCESDERWLHSEVLFLAIKDREEDSLLPFFDYTSEYIHERLRPRRGGHDSPGVLVHCRAGHHRSPCVAASYLVKYRGLSSYDARCVVKLGRPIADFTEWHTNQLDVFGEQNEKSKR